MNRELPREVQEKLSKCFEEILKEYYDGKVHWNKVGALSGFPTYQITTTRTIKDWPNSDDPKNANLTSEVVDKKYTVSIFTSLDYEYKGEE